MKTTDLWFSAYLLSKGYKVKDFTIISRGKGSYEFDINIEKWKKLKLEFLNSECSKFKQIMEELRDLLF